MPKESLSIALERTAKAIVSVFNRTKEKSGEDSDTNAALQFADTLEEIVVFLRENSSSIPTHLSPQPRASWFGEEIEDDDEKVADEVFSGEDPRKDETLDLPMQSRFTKV